MKDISTGDVDWILLFNNMKKDIAKLIWFELELCPHQFRFAIIPDQPILIGFSGEYFGRDKGAVLLVRKEEVPEMFEDIIVKTDKLLKKYKIIDLPRHNADAVFADKNMKEVSLHVRVAYDNQKLASLFLLNQMPLGMEKFLGELKEFAIKIFDAPSRRPISYGHAKNIVKGGDRPLGKNEGPVGKIKVFNNNKIVFNDDEMNINELRRRLALLQESCGQVWYYREEPQGKTPPAIAMEVIKAVTDFKLPISLSGKPDFSDYIGDDGHSYPR